MAKQEHWLFWDVDTQWDFMSPEGKLYVPEAETLWPNLGRLTAAARQQGIPLIASADDHRLADAEISDSPNWRTTFPPHCMHGTPGAERIPQTRLREPLVLDLEPLPAAQLAKALAGVREILILKRTVDVFSNPNAEPAVRALAPERIIVFGVALDICNRRAVEGLWDRGFRRLSVVTDATKAIDARLGAQLLESWEERGIELVTTEQILEELAAR
jgi:nicotinamidase/pyrazinamidase